MHDRISIRNAIVSALTGETAVADRIYPERSVPVRAAITPFILVYANGESVEIFQESPRQYKRILSVSVEIISRANDNLENDLDTIAQQVESILVQDYTLGDTATDLIQTGTELTILPDGETNIGSCVLSYQVPYLTLEVSDQSEENAWTDFDGVNVRYQRPEVYEVASGQFDAEDTINLE